MIKDSNIQKSIVISRELNAKINEEAKKSFSSSNWVVRKILTDYFKKKGE